MIAQQPVAVKSRDYTKRLLALRDCQVSVLHDKRDAEKHGDWAWVAECDKDMALLEAEVNTLTNGRGF